MAIPGVFSAVDPMARGTSGFHVGVDELTDIAAFHVPHHHVRCDAIIRVEQSNATLCGYL